MEEELPVPTGGATRRDLFRPVPSSLAPAVLSQLLAVNCQFIKKGRIPCEPLAHLLPFSLAAHMITKLPVFFPAVRMAMVVMTIQFILTQSRELLPGREEVPPHSVHRGL